MIRTRLFGLRRVKAPCPACLERKSATPMRSERGSWVSINTHRRPGPAGTGADGRPVRCPGSRAEVDVELATAR